MEINHARVGVFSDEGPPVPIPNTEVKLISADNTWLEAAREDKAMPTQFQVLQTLGYFFAKKNAVLSADQKAKQKADIFKV